MDVPKLYYVNGKEVNWRRRWSYGGPHWLAGSCGARWVPFARNVKVGNIGIKIACGHNQPESKDDKYIVTHINTSNGPLTIGVRKRVR